MSNVEDTDAAPAEPARPAEAGMPRWVKVFVVIAALIVVLVVAAQFMGGGHGPGRHGGVHRSPIDRTS